MPVLEESAAEQQAIPEKDAAAQFGELQKGSIMKLDQFLMTDFFIVPNQMGLILS